MNDADVTLIYRAHLAGACGTELWPGEGVEDCPVCAQEMEYAECLLGDPVGQMEWMEQLENDFETELCHRPPPGWWCSRDPGHEGPCAARPL
jgi:hypothetical protein